MSADESAVTVGDTVHLHVKVTNTGNVALTNVAITDANAPGCQAAPFCRGGRRGPERELHARRHRR